MVQEKYGVQLSTQEKGRLRQMIRAGRSSAQAITRARILLKTDQGWTASQVAAALDISERTVFRAKRRYAEEGLDEVLRHRNQVSRYRKLDDRGEAHLIALACSPPPEGHDHWTLRLLAGKVVELGLTPSMSHEGVRKRLKKTPSSRGRRRSGAFPR
jgi:transposase